MAYLTWNASGVPVPRMNVQMLCARAINPRIRPGAPGNNPRPMLPPAIADNFKKVRLSVVMSNLLINYSLIR
jgi:hypothetical protein